MGLEKILNCFRGVTKMSNDKEEKELPSGIYPVEESETYRDKSIDKEFIKKILYSDSTSAYVDAFEDLTGIKIKEED